MLEAIPDARANRRLTVVDVALYGLAGRGAGVASRDTAEGELRLSGWFAPAAAGELLIVNDAHFGILIVRGEK